MENVSRSLKGSLINWHFFGTCYQIQIYESFYQFRNVSYATCFDIFYYQKLNVRNHMADIKNMLMLIIIIDNVVAKRRFSGRVSHYYIWFSKVFFQCHDLHFYVNSFFVTH